MPGRLSRTRLQRPVEYRDREGRVWAASSIAQLKVVSAAIDGPSHFLVIRFEREGEERFARWIGGDEWRRQRSLHRLFVEAEGGTPEGRPSAPPPDATADDRGVGPAPIATVVAWINLVASMGPDELADFEERTFRQWDPASLGDLRRAIDRRRRELWG